MPKLRLDPTAPNGISIASDDPSMGQLRRQNNGYVVNKATGLIKAGTNVTLSGSGVSNDPYVINSSGTGGGTTLPADAAGWLHDDGAGTLAWSTPSKSDVGLGNVDNTSDATKNSAVATLTNKDLTSGTNTFPTLNQDTTGKSAKTDALNSATTTVNVAAATAPTSGQVLTATSSTAATWQTPASGGMSNPMTTLGDMIYEDSTPIQTRLAGNTTTTKKFLTQTGTGSASAAPAWGTIAAADVPTLNQSTTGTASNVTGTVAVANGGTGVGTLTGLVKGNGTSAMTAATAGTDYSVPSGVETFSGAKTFNDSKLLLAGATSGSTTLKATAAASGVVTLPAATDTLMGKATTDTLTNKTFDTAGTGNVFKIAGVAISAVTGTGSNVLSASPALTGTPTAPTASANDNSTTIATTGYVGLRYRNDNGSAGTAPSQREVGWTRTAYPTTVNNVAVNVTFKNAFPAGVVPIVVGTFAGDSSTASAYGTGGNVIVAGMTFKVYSISNTGFTFRIDSRDGGTFTAGYFFITYIAEA